MAVSISSIDPGTSQSFQPPPPLPSAPCCQMQIREGSFNSTNCGIYTARQGNWQAR